MTRRERLQVARYRAFRDRVHEGPLYTVLSETKQAGKQADPFEGMPTYTQKYQKRTRRLPKLDTRPYGRFSHLPIYSSFRYQTTH